jgi:hypothetical protein
LGLLLEEVTLDLLVFLACSSITWLALSQTTRYNTYVAPRVPSSFGESLRRTCRSQTAGEAWLVPGQQTGSVDPASLLGKVGLGMLVARR